MCGMNDKYDRPHGVTTPMCQYNGNIVVVVTLIIIIIIIIIIIVVVVVVIIIVTIIIIINIVIIIAIAVAVIIIIIIFYTLATTSNYVFMITKSHITTTMLEKTGDHEQEILELAQTFRPTNNKTHYHHE